MEIQVSSLDPNKFFRHHSLKMASLATESKTKSTKKKGGEAKPLPRFGRVKNNLKMVRIYFSSCCFLHRHCVGLIVFTNQNLTTSSSQLLSQLSFLSRELSVSQMLANHHSLIFLPSLARQRLLTFLFVLLIQTNPVVQFLTNVTNFYVIFGIHQASTQRTYS